MIKKIKDWNIIGEVLYLAHNVLSEIEQQWKSYYISKSENWPLKKNPKSCSSFTTCILGSLMWYYCSTTCYYISKPHKRDLALHHSLFQKSKYCQH